MWHVVAYVVGILTGAVGIFFALEAKRRKLDERTKYLADQERRNREQHKSITSDREALASQMGDFKKAKADFDARRVSYEELRGENTILKRDLHNVDVHMRKFQLDRDQQQQDHDSITKRTEELGGQFLTDNVNWISSSLTPNNFASKKQRLQRIIESCRKMGLNVSPQEENELLEALKAEYEKVVRAAVEREEQMRIKAQIREEQKLEREIERELKQLERERAAIQAALETALAEAKDEHSAEIEGLRARLAEAEEKSQRAISRAQMTKSGHVYVISNIGSFGEGVVKIGMTRRLEPLDRVKELGDASVPFPFDVHMMISSDDAPALERVLHHEFHKHRLNKTNPRKEFFRADLDALHRIVEESHGEVEYVADAEALEYRQSLEMADEDEEFIEEVYAKFDDEDGNADGDDD